MATKVNAGKRTRSVGPDSLVINQAVALYARVSTEDQAERQTIKAQIDFLHRWTELHGVPVAGEYIDDGISGTVPLEQRPEGGRLLTDAEACLFGAVVVYRLDRVGRSLRVLLDANDALTRFGVAIKSGTEPFDTSNPIGQFVFNLLGSMAELEKSTIIERTSLGRNRVAADGKYTGGPIPLGYDLDDDGRLIPSARPMPQLGVSEADFIRDLFRRIADGEASVIGECRRLTQLGVPRRQRYGGKRGRVIERTGAWGPSSLGTIIHNPVYKGVGQVASRYGEVERPTPALVDETTWRRAQDALLRSRNLSTKNAKNIYLLRGLVHCAGCGMSYVGSVSSGRRKYRCNTNPLRPGARCDAKALPADWLEAAVWEECRKFIMNPGEALEQAQQRMRERLSESTEFEERRRRVLADLAAKESERERVLTLFRRGTICDAEAERELGAVAREAGQLRELLESMRAQAALIEAQEAYLTDSTALLARLSDELATIDATNDVSRKREIIERYVRTITVETRRVGPRRLEADVRVYLRLKPEPIAVENVMSSPGGRRWKQSASNWRSGGFTAGSA